MDTPETKIYLAVIITALVLGIIIIYFTVSVIRQQRRNFALQKKLIIAEIDTLEKERARTAADLHDELGPLLSVIKFRVDDAKEGNPELDKASEHLDDMIIRIREIANNLMPVALQRKGLIIAIKEYISNAERSGALKIQFSYEASLSLPPEKSIHIYRVIQETIHNCIKHADATLLIIELKKQNDHLQVFCKDNGKGFDTTKQNSSGMGLSSIRNRTQIMGGSTIIESKPGIGTAIIFDIPLN